MRFGAFVCFSDIGVEDVTGIGLKILLLAGKCPRRQVGGGILAIRCLLMFFGVFLNTYDIN